MIIEISKDNLSNISLNPTEDEELAQNLAILLETPKGSVPLERGIGIDQGYIGQHFHTAAVALEAELTEAIDNYEPRVVLESLALKHSEDGTTTAVLEVTRTDG